MNRRLRARHRLGVAALGLTVPPLLVAALLDRPPLQQADVLAGSGILGGVPLTGEGALSEGAVHAVLERTPDGRLELVLQAVEDPGLPDLLAYWYPADEGGGGTDAEMGAVLSGEELLLGPFHGDRPLGFPLPVDRPSGRLVLYSLGHAEVVLSSSLSDLEVRP